MVLYCNHVDFLILAVTSQLSSKAFFLRPIEMLSISNFGFCPLEIPESDVVPGTILVTEEQLSRCIEDIYKVGNLSH